MHRDSTQSALPSNVLDWCVRSGQRRLRDGDLENALRWCGIAAKCAELFGSDRFFDAQLEQILITAGRTLPTHVPRRPAPRALTWLHVFTSTHSIGGHTALACRWIAGDNSGDTHNLVLTEQDPSDVPAPFREALKAKQGFISSLTHLGSIERKAEELRATAVAVDVVVLHIHPDDIVPAVAFGSSGGPPVLLLNHADHIFWVGANVCDAIINIRSSGEICCRRFRGHDLSFTLPVPLPPPTARQGDAIGGSLRGELGIPAGSPVFLTIGREFKYRAMKGMNFHEAATRLLTRLPNAWLLAVGPRPDDRQWAELAARTGGRAIAVGSQTNLAPYLAAADVYLEGFPFGSLTALLEAALAGIPPVLAPMTCPLPFRSDDLALDDITPPEDVDEYVAQAEALANDEHARAALGKLLSASVERIHCGPTWQEHLEGIRNWVRQGPPHSVLCRLPEERLAPNLVAYWAEFLSRSYSDDPFRYAFRAALTAGLRPRVDRTLFAQLLGTTPSLRTISRALAIGLGSHVLATMPSTAANWLYMKT